MILAYVSNISLTLGYYMNLSLDLKASVHLPQSCQNEKNIYSAVTGDVKRRLTTGKGLFYIISEILPYL